jgi:hypothetical protein
MPDGGFFELLEHLAVTQDELEILGLAAGIERLAVDLAFEIDRHAVGPGRPASCGRCAKVRRCLRRMSSVLSIAASDTSEDSFSTSALARSPSLTSGRHFEHRVEGQLALGRAFLFGDARLAGHPQVGFVGGAWRRLRRPCRS